LVLADLWEHEALLGELVVDFSVDGAEGVEVEEAVGDVEGFGADDLGIPLGLKHLSKGTFPSNVPIAHEGFLKLGKT